MKIWRTNINDTAFLAEVNTEPDAQLRQVEDGHDHLGGHHTHKARSESSQRVEEAVDLEQQRSRRAEVGRSRALLLEPGQREEGHDRREGAEAEEDERAEVAGHLEVQEEHAEHVEGDVDPGEPGAAVLAVHGGYVGAHGQGVDGHGVHEVVPVEHVGGLRQGGEKQTQADVLGVHAQHGLGVGDVGDEVEQGQHAQDAVHDDPGLLSGQGGVGRGVHPGEHVVRHDAGVGQELDDSAHHVGVAQDLVGEGASQARVAAAWARVFFFAARFWWAWRRVTTFWFFGRGSTGVFFGTTRTFLFWAARVLWGTRVLLRA